MCVEAQITILQSTFANVAASYTHLENSRMFLLFDILCYNIAAQHVYGWNYDNNVTLAVQVCFPMT